MKELFTKEEIEKYGFIYEPDSRKCKLSQTGPHYDCTYVENGKIVGKNEHEIDDEWKSNAMEIIKYRSKGYGWRYINSIFVLDIG